MELYKILVIVFLILFIYAILRHFMTKSNILTYTTSASQMQTIQASSLANPNNSTNFTYSIWMYINDWNYKYGEVKPVLGRMTDMSTQDAGSVEGVAGKGPCPLVVLGAVSNNLSVYMSTFSSTSTTVENKPTRCVVENIPIQRWVNLLLSVYGKTMDIYIDGKLVKTCILDGVPNINNNANVYVTPNGGFSGYTSKLQFFSDATDPQKAYNIYRSGPGNNIFSSLFKGYQVQLNLVQNGQVSGSLTI